MRVLFVCLGNICRSPAAEAVFRAAVGQAHAIDSAGTSDWHVGEPPYGPMQQAAKARGVDLSGLRARQFQPEDFERFDLIIGMDGENLQAIDRLRPPGNDTDVRLFTDYAPKTNAVAVPDPYYSRDFDGALDLIKACATGLKRALEER
jgi:protein-tyrosine phosphatase